MGWAINYGLSTDETDVKAIRSLVQSIWVLATRLPFARVSDIVEMRGDECLHHDRDDPHLEVKIQARWLLLDAGQLITVSPLHIIAFAAERGEGSEPAIIGLCRYPDFIDSELSNTRLCTKLKGWKWKSSATAHTLAIRPQTARPASCAATSASSHCSMPSRIASSPGLRLTTRAITHVIATSANWPNLSARGRRWWP